MIVLGALLTAASLLTGGRGRRIGLMFAMAVMLPPAVAVATAVVSGFARGRAVWIERGAGAVRHAADELLVARLLTVCVAAGLTVPVGLGVAQRFVAAEYAETIGRVRRRAAMTGWGESFDAERRQGSELFQVLGRAHRTGGAVSAALQSHLDEAESRRVHEMAQRTRRLPVTLLLPLTLLTLPGCVVLLVGPALLNGADRILGPLL